MCKIHQNTGIKIKITHDPKELILTYFFPVIFIFLELNKDSLNGKLQSNVAI